MRLIYECTKPITTNDELNSLFGKIRIGAEWLLRRSGPLAVGINQGGLFTRVLPESTTPDIQFHIATLSADMAGAKPHPFSGFTLSVCQLRPTSRGSVTLASHDPMAAPRMFANYLSTETDRRCVTAAIAFARKLAATEPLRRYVKAERAPGPGAAADEDLLQFARDYGATIFHPSGTCRMGSDADAVVDPRLRVRGVERLWVADCSIMPTLVSGNTTCQRYDRRESFRHDPRRHRPAIIRKTESRRAHELGKQTKAAERDPAPVQKHKHTKRVLIETEWKQSRRILMAVSATGNKGVAEQDVKRVVFASLVGATIEWYDFFPVRRGRRHRLQQTVLPRRRCFCRDNARLRNVRRGLRRTAGWRHHFRSFR